VDTRIPELLRDLAEEARPDPSLEGRTLRRARRRRLRNASLGGVGVLAAILVAAAAARALLALLPERRVPGGSPSPSVAAPVEAFPGIYPQASWADLQRDQRAVDDGHHPLWTTPEGVAAEFAVAVLGWDPADVVAERNTRQDLGAAVVLANRASGPPTGDPQPAQPGAAIVQLEQLGRGGDRGIWTITLVEGGGLVLERPHAWTGVIPGERLAVVGRVDPSLGVGSVQATIQDSLLGGAARDGVADPAGDGSFRIELPVPPSGDGTLVLLVRALGPDGSGQALSATAFPLRAGEGTAAEARIPHLEPQPGLPDAVAAKRQAIFVAAAGGDLDALAALADPRTFTFSFGADADPARSWRAVERAGGEGPRDVIPALLNASYGTLESGAGTIYVWPSAAAVRDPSLLSEAQRDELRALGYSEREIRVVGDGGLSGWRLGIAEDGRWIFFVAGD
jgi:hypothetical protein